MLRVRIDALVDEVAPERLAPAIAHVERAATEARRGDPDDGWKYFHAARRLVFELQPAAVQEAERVVLAKECSEKLRDWRKQSAAALLALPGTTALVHAMELRDDAFDNMYFKNRLVRRQMTVLALALAAFAALFVVSLCVEPHLATTFRGVELALWPTLASLALGAMGACLSALISFSSASATRRIPEHLANVFTTLSRPIIGAISGLLGYLMLQSKIFPLDPASAGWIIPFVFGFSERVVIGALANQGTAANGGGGGGKGAGEG
jgi:hypothetical protein